MTEVPSNSFQPAPPPGESSVSPSTAQRPRRQRTAAPKSTKKAAVPKTAKAAKKAAPKVPKTLHAVTDAEIAAGAAKKKRVSKKAKVERVAPDTVKVSLKEYASMRCGDGAKLFLKAHKLLSGATAGARRTVLAELAKMFG